MPEIIKSKLKSNEIEFMKYWEDVVLKNKNKITPGMLDYASNLLGANRTGNCSTCMKNDALEMNNKYNILLSVYNQHKLEISELQKEIEKTKEEFNNQINLLETDVKKNIKKKK